ncbi:unnamed protein product [Brassicogethes aeneus]|uniref:Serine/threonine-protein kinase receptor n=1 Tax=Brassicogethes aeneus TaxID=1431903 RepID=A0A9P0AWZ3_BRAAE|nr:unnamed protein product [Brassicogethes aeneus]
MNNPIIALGLLLLIINKVSCKETIKCVNSMNYNAHFSEDVTSDDSGNEDSPFIECDSYCYTFWTEDATNGTVIMRQGCWHASGKPNECDPGDCKADKEPPKAMEAAKFCCCSSPMCNENFTDAYVPLNETAAPPAVYEPSELVVFAGVCLGVAAVFFLPYVLYYVIYRCPLYRKKSKEFDVEESDSIETVTTTISLRNMMLEEVIGQGRYGCVWRGVIDGKQLAVKVFQSHHRHYYLNENEMYRVAGECSALLNCLGSGEYQVTPGGPTDHLLLLSLEQECLQEYLKVHTLDVPVLTKMSLGVAKGLSHLHCDLGKPCIVHRDLNTKNVLVRSDLSCVISDLGLALIPRRSENRAFSEAGTLRYMAPEVLEGAVNLRDCESALKQIDVYALGLVLWELGSRCSDMQNAEPHPYAPPFAKEAGENPSLEQMQTLVSRRKARPLWPASWKNTAAARLLCETSEDCWDQDAEARLTALCVAERLLELPHLKGRILHPMHPPASPTPLINNNHLHGHQIDASVGTIETLLSPSEEHCKNSNHLANCVNPMQPYQGRNPCLERNLLSGSSDSLLIDKSSKHCTNSDSQNLITNDYLNFQVNHRATPIPYLQNAVHGGPKQQNTVKETPTKAKFKWYGLKKLFNHKKTSDSSCCKDTQVKLNTKLVNGFGKNGVTTSLLHGAKEAPRPSTLPLSVAKPAPDSTNSGVQQILGRNKNSLSRQRSLEQFNEVFSSASDLSRLKDPSTRVKTPGDVPPSVRRTRGKAATESRYSLYDDSIMCRGQWGSAPDLEPPGPLNPPQLNDLQDRESVSSF